MRRTASVGCNGRVSDPGMAICGASRLAAYRSTGHVAGNDPSIGHGDFDVFVGGVCQEAAGGVFRLFTTNFKVGAERNHQIEALVVSFGYSLVILLVKNNFKSVLITPYIFPNSRATGGESGPRAGAAQSVKSVPFAPDRRPEKWRKSS